MSASLYIEGTKVDLFDDVHINITDSIKTAKDMGVVSTAYTQQFRLPASKTNNKLFQHYYSVEVWGGFDPRRKHSALLQIAGADFQKGYIKLNGVDLKNGIAHAYRVQFFGELSSVKDKMGEDLLEDLTWLNRFNHLYDIDTVRDGFEAGLGYGTTYSLSTDPNDFYLGLEISRQDDGQIIYPFISHTRGFQIDNNGVYDITQTGSVVLADRLAHTDLKPAIKVREVLRAMEFKYDIKWGGDFIESDMFNDLFLWCHREKGGLKKGSQTLNDIALTRVISDGNDPNEFEFDSGTDQRVLTTWDEDIQGNGGQYYECELDFTTVSGGVYEVEVISTNSQGYQFIDQYELEDNATVNFNIVSRDNNPVTWRIEVNIYAASDLLDLTPTLTIERFAGGATQDTGVYGNVSENLLEDVILTDVLPKMKCIDFLRGLFKLFNLVAYGQLTNLMNDEYEIVIEPLDDFYNSGRAWDITPYVDLSDHSVERVAPYHLLMFEFEEPKTFLVRNANEVSRLNFGNAKFNTQDLLQGESNFLFDGGSYEIQPGFEKMMYERMTQLDTEVLTQIQWGWFVNDFSENTPEPELGAPLLFFRNNRDCDVNQIKWIDDTNTSTTYNAPTNVTSDNAYTLNYDVELDEYTRTVNENSLFNKFYKTYIDGVYDINARRVVINAVLGVEFIYNYKLRDKVVINHTAYQIEKIDINLVTRRAKLELLKITADQEVYDVKDDCYSVAGYVVDDYWCGEGYTPKLSYT